MSAATSPRFASGMRSRASAPGATQRSDGERLSRPPAGTAAKNLRRTRRSA